METKLKNTVLQLKDGPYIHYSKVQNYNKFGYQALFTNNDSGALYQVQFFSRSVLNLNALSEHLNRVIALFQTLNSRKIAPIIEVIEKPDSIIVISQGYQKVLGELIEDREGLTAFEVGYFLGDLHQLFGYLRSREICLEKVGPNDLYLTEQLKLVVGFSIFLNRVGEKPVIKKLAFRNQTRNRNNCPDLFFCKEISIGVIDDVNSWHMGVILYQIVENRLPFVHSNDDLIGKARGQNENQIASMLIKQYKPQFKETQYSPEMVDLLKKLLKPNPKERLKFAVVIIHPFIKKFPIPPHILPTTVFSCPPSQNFKQQYFKKFIPDEHQRSYENGKEQRMMTATTAGERLRSQKEMTKGSQKFEKDRLFRTQHQIASEVTLSETFVMIEEFVDISDSFGYGYQMNTGIVGFVFNDETEFLCGTGCQEIRSRCRGKNKQQILYSYQKLPEEDEVRKKIFILEAFMKTLKRKRISGSEKERKVTVSQYCRTKYASIFLLTNDQVQVFFNDKVGFLLTKNQVYVQCKNSEKFEHYDYSKFDTDMQLRRDYCLAVAHKVFSWDGRLEDILDTDRLHFDQQLS